MYFRFFHLVNTIFEPINNRRNAIRQHYFMESVIVTFEAISFLLALLAAVILLFVNKELRHSNRMLALVLMMLALTSLNSAFLDSRLFLEFPRLHKLALPFSLLIAPFAYLYLRSILLGELNFRKYDWLLLLPAALYTINLIPYYTMPFAEKQAHLIEFYKDKSLQGLFNEGIFSAHVFPFLRVAWSILFFIINIRIITRFKKLTAKQVLIDNKELLRWLTIFNGLLIGLIGVSLVNSILVLLIKTNLLLSDLALGTSVMVICMALFIRPKLLYGVFQPVSVITGTDTVERKKPGSMDPVIPEKLPDEIISNVNEILESDTELGISHSDSYRYKKILETLFQEEKPFLQTGYSLEQLVADTNIPRYTLSAFINREYGMGFREFLNRYRVDYFKANLNNTDWKNFTLEAIAEQCGFNSRSSFIKNFKEITGQTPSEYIKRNHVKGTP